jgi:TolB-like protein/DNA-binding winged helix-turn-helix (wHTH) protein
VRLQELPFRLLTILLERAGDIVTREELRQSLWPEGTYVEFDGSLNAALKKLRFALGDDAENPIFIETVPKRGYRFIAPVECERPEEISAPVSEPESVVMPAASQRLSPDSRPAWRLGWIVMGAAVLLLLIGWRYTRRSQSGAPAQRKVIAVLPFSNEGAGADFDYLRYAIANDLVTDLTYAQSVSVRPFSSTTKYGSQPFDPAAVGKELRVTHVLAGGFLRDQQNLRVNLELIEVAQNQTVWRDEVSVAPQELIALHDKLAVAASQGLLPAINIPAVSPENVPGPRNEQAFDLFQHSLVIPLDPGPNQNAIHTLEQSVSLDGGYTPAWSQLSWRYYIDYHYGSGGEAAREKSLLASRRQSELDPSTPPISTTIRTEQGDLDVAYDQAAEFLRRRPDASMAHFWMSYVLRYAGLVDEAGKECDAGLALDPGFNVFRSCASTFIMAADYAHAQEYISVDESSGFAALMRLQIALRARDAAAALTDANAVAQLGFRNVDAKLVRAYLNHASAAEFANTVAEVEADPVSSRDPELLYQNADALAFCGQPDGALRQLGKAVKGNYCSYPAMDRDSLFDSIRQQPEFEAIRQAGIQCQQSFLAHRAQVRAPLSASHQ